ncbi:MAG: helix-turn-helix domain-containing protein [Clostridiales bacterium]|nr:helix-turn-helix domain-containing protein [Clostridiales bacterium]
MVGYNIRRFREAKGLTQEQLAERLNVTRQAVSNWETEKTQPDIDTLQRIAQVLEVSVEELIYGEKRENKTIVNNNVTKNIKKGLSFGAGLAMVISYVNWGSVGWAIFHGLLNWLYVVYYVLRYGWS